MSKVDQLHLTVFVSFIINVVLIYRCFFSFKFSYTDEIAEEYEINGTYHHKKVYVIKRVYKNGKIQYRKQTISTRYKF